MNALADLESIVTQHVEPLALRTDSEARFPRETLPDELPCVRDTFEHLCDELAGSASFNAAEIDAHTLIAAIRLSSEKAEALPRGHEIIQQLKHEMAAGRRARLARLGFGKEEAQRLADLHTRNFM